ncbi:MAG: hypothetical protein B0W54_17360 [Cellvibrio sp. 79]|nr:MAG: hypothetical protein B0W54_17360 [Cellvibrio sp. 79]
MSTLSYTNRLALPDRNSNDTHPVGQKSGKRPSDKSACTPGELSQATHTQHTELYEKPVFLVIIFLMFELNLSVHLYCANYLMSQL